MGDIYTHHYHLNTFDFDQNRNVRLVSLMNFLQDISTRHFEAVIERNAEVESPGLWVIVEWHIELYDGIDAPMKVALTTEPTYFRKFIGYRRYDMQREDGGTLLKAYSKWAYIDSKTRTQLNIPERFYACFSVDAGAERPTWKNKFKAEEAPFSEHLFKSHYSDVDVNRHVNNVTYIRWGLDAVFSDKPEWVDRYPIKRLKVTFKKETFGGDKVRVSGHYTETDETAQSLHFLTNDAGEICVEMEALWDKVAPKA
ncbi:MAG: hypothetical protein PWQ12_89 [Clostridiales bacterium]|nr:hypothetical protein [Clostridiales bacterium]